MRHGGAGDRPCRQRARRRPLRARRWASTRLTYLDNLKVVLIAAIIALHAVLGYAGIVEVWTYSELREVTLTPVVEVGLFVLVSPFGFFLVALLFLVAGLAVSSTRRLAPLRPWQGSRDCAGVSE